MVDVATSDIDPQLPRTLEHASSELMARIRQAISGFYASPPQDSASWETWRTPKPWETRVLPNLERSHADLQHAVRAHAAGDIKPITLAASGYSALSKDLDFDMRWMTPPDHEAVREAIGQVVSIADRIHRLGYDALAKAGRV
jgi:hypothetical protein